MIRKRRPPRPRRPSARPTTPDRAKSGRRLAALRLALDMSQEDLAALLGITRQGVAAIEARGLEESTLERLARVLGLELAALAALREGRATVEEVLAKRGIAA